VEGNLTASKAISYSETISEQDQADSRGSSAESEEKVSVLFSGGFFVCQRFSTRNLKNPNLTGKLLMRKRVNESCICNRQ
jgi:hypothetical protein